MQLLSACLSRQFFSNQSRMDGYNGDYILQQLAEGGEEISESEILTPVKPALVCQRAHYVE